MIRVGIIGIGKWGINHLRIYSELEKLTDVKLVGISDIDINKKKLADENKINFFSDYIDLLSHVDAVSVVVPTNKHYEITKKCLLKGKHVLVEKPLTLNLKETTELVNLAKEKKLILNVGYLFRFNPVVNELKKQLSNIDDIRYIVCRYIQPKLPRDDSGVIFNIGIHLVDTLNFIFNEKPNSVLCRTKNSFSSELEDSAVILLKYNKFYVILEIACYHPLKKRDMLLVGSNASFYADFLNQTLTFYNSNKNDIEWSTKDIKLKKNEPLKEEIFHFLSSLEHKITNMGKEQIDTIRICEKALESARLGIQLKL